MAERMVRILDGNTFVVSDERGDIEASTTDPTGLFSYDTRFLSTWVLTIDGQRLNALSTDDLQYFEARFFLVPGDRHGLHRPQAVGHPPAGGRRRLPRGADDPQPRRRAGRPRRPHRRRERLRRPVRGQGRAREAGRVLDTQIDDAQLVLGYQRETFRRETTISATAPAKVDEHGSHVHRPDRAARHVDDGPRRRHGHRGRRRHAREHEVRAWPQRKADPNMERGLEEWIDEAPHLECDWEPLKATYRRSLIDLAALRFSPPIAGGHSLPGGRPAVVHDDVRPGQHLHQPPGAAVRAGARGDDAAGPRRLAGHPRRRLPRRGPRPDPPRDALRRDGRVRGAAALARTTARSTRRRCT